MADWSFLTSHARVLLCIAHDPGVRLRDIAARTGVTERTAYGIVTDLTEAGYVVKHQDGRRNRHQIQAHLLLPETRQPGTAPSARSWPSCRRLQMPPDLGTADQHARIVHSSGEPVRPASRKADAPGPPARSVAQQPGGTIDLRTRDAPPSARGSVISAA